MTGVRCVHGLDDRFCAICKRNARDRSPQGVAAVAERPTLAEVVSLLNREHVRATDDAVAQMLGVPVRSIAGLLGARSAEASWIVNAETGLPADYDQDEWHPDLLSGSEIIRTAHELTLRLTLWRSQPV